MSRGHRTVEIIHGGMAWELEYSYEYRQYRHEEEYDLESVRPQTQVPHQYGADLSEWLESNAWKSLDQIDNLARETLAKENREEVEE